MWSYGTRAVWRLLKNQEATVVQQIVKIAEKPNSLIQRGVWRFYYPIHIALYLLPIDTTYYQPHTTCYRLPTTYYLLPATHVIDYQWFMAPGSRLGPTHGQGGQPGPSRVQGRAISRLMPWINRLMPLLHRCMPLITRWMQLVKRGMLLINHLMQSINRLIWKVR